jgi:hypothetical protein
MRERVGEREITEYGAEVGSKIPKYHRNLAKSLVFYGLLTFGHTPPSRFLVADPIREP